MLTTITELPEYIKRADTLWKVQEAFVRYVGAEEIKEKVVVLELSITTTMNEPHYTF
jgi:hypothetical protein